MFHSIGNLNNSNDLVAMFSSELYCTSSLTVQKVEKGNDCFAAAFIRAKRSQDSAKYGLPIMIGQESFVSICENCRYTFFNKLMKFLLSSSVDFNDKFCRILMPQRADYMIYIQSIAPLVPTYFDKHSKICDKKKASHYVDHYSQKESACFVANESISAGS